MKKQFNYPLWESPLLLIPVYVIIEATKRPQASCLKRDER